MFIIKMIFLWPIFLWTLYRVNSYASRYRKDPAYNPIQQRNDWVLGKCKLLLWFFGIKVKVEGYEHLGKGPAILTPNHKSNIDPIVLIYALKKQSKEQGVMNKIPTFLAKKELAKKRTVRNALSLLDTFYVDRQNPRESVKQLASFGTHVKENRTFGIVFPEGTRIKENNLGEFNPGAFKVAISNYLPIVPVAISDTREALRKTRFKKLIVNVKFLPVQKPNSFITMETHAISKKIKNQIEGEINVWNNKH
ncbi:1-acyl-sn-glycerol-3-phosphate acyltransferase [Mycoplasmopsis maculosa]|uniref:1-acyl-sn-glycerol-3-phosphate acyltransferase n=1 Tax=Mycoplasmopsis maculosa TaxID=114885 RepID=A0A449B4I7_9BACT|nr:lysophospholipid acyltransferase family protein [Mycoplasmopsis maculosa]VEU75521.1 1-acyl-sn-glycerol-3-phosphate acyltransferase [Mycoplasmopsis maculosa]